MPLGEGSASSRADRKVDGVILPMAVRDNLGLPATMRAFRLFDPHARDRPSESDAVAKLLSIKAPGCDARGAP